MPYEGFRIRAKFPQKVPVSALIYKFSVMYRIAENFQGVQIFVFFEDVYFFAKLTY